jgi:hypothetical protein
MSTPGKRRKTNWHALVFYGTLFLTTVCTAAVALHPKHRLVTLLEVDARDQFRNCVYRYLGWQVPPREGQIFNAPVPASSPSLHAR